MRLSRRAGVILFSAISSVPIVARAATTATLRIVEYNVDQDTTGSYDFSGNISTVLSAIGSYSTSKVITGGSTVSSAAHQIDVIALTEMSATTVTSGANIGASVTADTVAADLNKLYGVTTYRASTAVYGYSASDLAYTGNGPSGIVYNSATVNLSATTIVSGSASTNESRIPVRYTLQAVGSSSASAFNLYVEHTKADQGVDDASKRTNETLLVRQNADNAGNANVIYTGDFNLAGSTNSSTTSGSAEYAFKNLTAASGSSLYSATYTSSPSSISYTAAATAGARGKANDPMSSSFVGDDKTGANTAVYSESATDLTAPFDAQLVSDAILNGTGGLTLVPDSELVFGNSYYVNGVLTTTNAEGKALSDYSTFGGSTVVAGALENTTDHLPVIADYTVVVPEPGAFGLLAIATAGTLLRRRRKTKPASAQRHTGISVSLAFQNPAQWLFDRGQILRQRVSSSLQKYLLQGAFACPKKNPC